MAAKFHSSTSIGRRHLGFNFCLIFWHTCT